MTAALIDTLARVEPASTGARSSRSAKATTSFDDAINDAVAQTEDAPSDRERPAAAKKRHEHADHEHRASEAGLVAHLSPTIEQRGHDAHHRSAGSRLSPVEGRATAPQRGADRAPASGRTGHGHASVTSGNRYDAMHLDAASHTDGKEPAVRTDRTGTTTPSHARASEVLQRGDATAAKAENKAAAPLAATSAASGDQGKTTSTQHDANAPRVGSAVHSPAADPKSTTAAKTATPTDTAQAPAGRPASVSTSAPHTPASTPTPQRAAAHTGSAEAPTTRTAERQAAATPMHSALRETAWARESSYLKATGTARPTQQAGKQPTAADAPVIPVHLPAASATTINSTPVVATAAPTVPVPLAQPDVAAILASLRGGPDGTFQLRAQVHPAELGSVNITATVAGGSLTVLLTGDTQAHHALSQALPQLRAHLADQGFTGVDVGLGSPDQQAGQTGGQSGEHHTQGSDRPLGAGIGPDGPAETHAPTPLRRAAGAIDTML